MVSSAAATLFLEGLSAVSRVWGAALEEPPPQVPFAEKFTARPPGQEGLGVDPVWTVALPLPGRGHREGLGP